MSGARGGTRRWAVLAVVLAAAAALAGCGGSDTSSATGTPTPTSGTSRTAATSPTGKPNAKPSAGRTAAGKSGSASGASSGSTVVARIEFVDVGQGDCAVVKAGAWAGLIDGGPSGDEAAVSSALRHLGVRRLDAVVISHPHADHTGGLQSVVSEYRPQKAYVGEGAGTAADDLEGVGCSVVQVHRGQTLSFGRLRAKVLSPSSLSGDANADSVVLLLTVAGRRFLFTGDCTGPDEAAVAAICARGPPLYLLKVAHHGSRYSTGASFIDDTRPAYAVISVGHNSYGHPAESTVAGLRREGARVYSTQKSGSMTLTIKASGAVSWSFGRSSAQLSKGVTRGSSGSSAGGSSSTGAAAGAAAAAAAAGSNAGGGTIVFITATGECYHRDGCRYLSHSRIAITLARAKARGYRPCSVCRPPT